MTALLGALALPGLGRPVEQQSQEQQAASQPKQAQSQNPAQTQKAAPAPAQTKPATPPAPKGDEACGGRPREVIQTPFGVIERCPPGPATPPAQATQAKPATQPAAQHGAEQKPAETSAAGQQPKPAGQAQPAAGAAQATPEQATQPGATAPVQPASPAGGGISLNLENADLYQVLRIIGSELKLNYVVDPVVKGNVTISTSGSVSRDELFTLLETILQLNGAMLVKVGAYYRVMPLADALKAPVPLEFVKKPTAPPPNTGLELQVVPMHFVSAADMGKILAPYVSSAGSLVVEQGGNILLITETPAKLQQLRELIDTFDGPEFARRRVRLFQVKNTPVEDLVPELQSVFNGYALGGKASAIEFIPLQRLNMILAVAPAPEVFSDVEKWIEKLDLPAPASGVRNYVYMVQNAKAGDLRRILTALYGGHVQENQPATPPAPEAPNPLVLPQAQPAPQSQTSSEAPESAPELAGHIRIMSDDEDNALIVQCTPTDYEMLKDTIKELDILPRQVLINAKIYQVTLTGSLSFGVSAYLNQIGQLPAPPGTSGSFVPGQTGGDLQAATFALIGKTRALELFLNATQNRSRVKMLSAPSILVSDDKTATIQVGAQVPVPLGSALTPIQSSGSSVFAQTISYRNTGVILTVTPRINASGVVTLDLTQEVSSPASNTTSGIVAPVINQTQFQTSVVLQDGEPLALGGLITTSNTLSRERIPLLGNIPVVGALFGSTSKQSDRTELVLILTPYVIQNMDQASRSTSGLLDEMKNVKQMLKKPD